MCRTPLPSKARRRWNSSRKAWSERDQRFDRGVDSLAVSQVEDVPYDILFGEIHDLIRPVCPGEFLPLRNRLNPDDQPARPGGATGPRDGNVLTWRGMSRRWQTTHHGSSGSSVSICRLVTLTARCRFTVTCWRWR